VEIEKSSVSGEIQSDGKGGYYEVTKDGQATPLKEASISLNDCLACRYLPRYEPWILTGIVDV
jgi:iron only hydrogenase large subunit-like protein